MKVKLKRVDQDFHFEGISASGVSNHIDGSSGIGGNSGARPMELILMGLGFCGEMDIIAILKKQKQDLQDLEIDIMGERNKEDIPAVFKKISINFLLYGNMEFLKVKKAVNLSMEKYCSVLAMFEKSVKISYSCNIIRD